MPVEQPLKINLGASQLAEKMVAKNSHPALSVDVESAAAANVFTASKTGSIAGKMDRKCMLNFLKIAFDQQRNADRRLRKAGVSEIARADALTRAGGTPALHLIQLTRL